jgi:hypothetical protein
MTYSEMRQLAQTGDVLLVEGKGFFSKMVRVVTGESISHVALLFWLDGGLFVAEMIEGKGYQIMPASQWFPRAAGPVLFGAAPVSVQSRGDTILAIIASYRDTKKKQRYGYLSLLKVWWAQITGQQIKVHQRVCSTFVQDVWEQCGFHFAQLADPGDYLALCRYVCAVEPAVEPALEPANA